jgi:DNA replication and repair protein RecF
VTLAQAATLAERSGEWPVFCADDLASELDDLHLRGALEWLLARPLQVLLTGVSQVDQLMQASSAVFHVEQGKVGQLV